MEVITTWYEGIRTWANANLSILVAGASLVTISAFAWKGRDFLKRVVNHPCARLGRIFKSDLKWEYVKDDNGNNLYSKGNFRISFEDKPYRIRDIVNGRFFPGTRHYWRWVARHHGQFIKESDKLEELFEYCDDVGKHSP